MKLLLIGGPRFLGLHLIEAALKAGHTVTTFNRGRTKPEMFPEIEKLHGERENDLSALEGRSWDAVIDTSGYLPQVVRKSATALAGSVGLYAFISTISVYADQGKHGLSEEDAVATIAPEVAAKAITNKDVTSELYGPLKGLCEQEVENALPGKTLNIRPGLIVGPYDLTDRFTYWVWRLAQGGEILAPGRPGRPVQFIDVRDLAEWTIRAVEQGLIGIYNATGPDYTLTMGAFLDETNRACGANATLTWVDDELLLKEEITPWMGLPLWIPETDPAFAGLGEVNVSKAVADGMTFRRVAETVRDTLAWDRTRPADIKRNAGLPREIERRVLFTWKNKNKR